MHVYSLYLAVVFSVLGLGEQVQKPNIPPHILEATAEAKAEYLISLLREDVCAEEKVGSPRALFKRSLSTLESIQYLVYLLKECNENSGHVMEQDTSGQSNQSESKNEIGASTTQNKIGLNATLAESTTIAKEKSTTAGTFTAESKKPSEMGNRTSTIQVVTTIQVTPAANTVKPVEPPFQCRSPDTVNLTESWRKDANGSNIKPINGNAACDHPRLSSRWFRFQGAAGRQLANSCRPDFSCGTHAGYWSDAQMPTDVGEMKTVPVYGSYQRNCKHFPDTLTVVRCSQQLGDFVYLYPNKYNCDLAMCGMD